MSREWPGLQSIQPYAACLSRPTRQFPVCHRGFICATGGALVGEGDAQQRRLVVQPSGDHQRLRHAVDEPVLQAHGGMTGQVGDRQALASPRGRQKHVDPRHQRLHLPAEQRAGALRADVLHRRDEAGRAKRVRPRAGVLLGQLVDAPAARQIVEGGGGLGGEDEVDRVGGEVRQLDRLEPGAGSREDVERVLQQRRTRRSDSASRAANSLAT